MVLHCVVLAIEFSASRWACGGTQGPMGRPCGACLAEKERQMKKRVAAGFLLWVVWTLPILAENVDLSGEWQITVTTNGRQAVYSASLVQQGKKLTVSMTKPGQERAYEGAGSVNGDEVQWTLTVPNGEKTYHVAYTGTIRSDVRMRGKVQFTGVIQGRWLADRSESN